MERIDAIDAEMAAIRQAAAGRRLTDDEEEQFTALSIERAAMFRQMQSRAPHASVYYPAKANRRTRRDNLIILGALMLWILPLLYYVQLLPDFVVDSTGEDGIPREGLLRAYPVFGASFASWRGSENDGMKMFHQGDSLHLAIDTSHWTESQFEGHSSWTVWGKRRTRSMAKDLSAAVEVRAVHAPSSAGACLIIRADRDVMRDDYSYNFCINGDGLYAWWFDESSDDYSTVEYFNSPEALSSVRPIGEWNTLKVIAKGDTAWLFVNGTLIGTTQHAGSKGGTVGIRVEADRSDAAEFAFRNLTVRGLGWI